MGHFAKLHANNEVKMVLVAEQEFIDTLPNPERYVKCSFNTQHGVHLEGGTPLRKNFPGRKFTYDPTRDAFIPPKPFDSWVLDEDKCDWLPPVTKPDDQGGRLDLETWWNESTQEWALTHPNVTWNAETNSYGGITSELGSWNESQSKWVYIDRDGNKMPTGYDFDAGEWVFEE